MIKSFNDFLQESAPSIVAGSPSEAAKTHKAVIRTNGGAIHHASEKNGVHTIVHSSKSGAMKVSEVSPSSEKNNTSSILTRRATDQEKSRYTGKLIVSDEK